MEVYVFKIKDEPVHAFLAPDNRAAACVVRTMIDRTISGYLTECTIAAAIEGAKKPSEPALFDAILYDRFSFERYDPNLGRIVIRDRDPLLSVDDLIYQAIEKAELVFAFGGDKNGNVHEFQQGS